MKVHGNAWRSGLVSNTFVFMGCIEWRLCIKRKGSEGVISPLEPLRGRVQRVHKVHRVQRVWYRPAGDEF